MPEPPTYRTSCRPKSIGSWLLLITPVDAFILLIPVMLNGGRSPYKLDIIRYSSFLSTITVEGLAVMTIVDTKSKPVMLTLIVAMVVQTLIGLILLVHPFLVDLRSRD